MLERTYRKRLDADLARWQSDGTITPAIHDAIRATLGPLPATATIATVVAIFGGLLIAAAFLAFVAANWEGIARPARFAILLAGIAGAYGLGAWFARSDKPILADLAVSVGAVVFGAAIALTGQMYHLSGDFAGALLLWAAGALAAAILTGSRGALAVALAVAIAWSITRIDDENIFPHWPFFAFWLTTASLALAWNSTVARHLVALSAVGWWMAAVGAGYNASFAQHASVIVTGGYVLLFGAGELLASRGAQTQRDFGTALATYAAFGLMLVLVLVCSDAWVSRTNEAAFPTLMLPIGLCGIAFAAASAVITRRAAPAMATLTLAVAFMAASTLGLFAWSAGRESWLLFALSLAAAATLVVSGMLDENRARTVAGWLGLAAMIAVITWSVQGSLLARAIFLASAGTAAIVLALVLGRLLPKESRQ
jgi:uncharacterized membrane protein